MDFLTATDAISAPGTITDILIRLFFAAGLGGAIGLNREWEQKPAGLRTHALVGLGSALFALVGLALALEGPEQDLTAPSRILQGLVAGVGFIGGGAILRREQSGSVEGLTTATSIWIVAAVGVATGVGMWRSALASVTIALVILTAGESIDRVLRRLRGRRGAGQGRQ
jgi:putative Mg2+ transporter-C (MgtC) family protein